MGANRLGDVIDDYCPRCRLLTNHSVVAMVEEEVKKVICRTCQYSHDYKHAKGAEKKKQKASAYDEVLASVLAGKSLESTAKPAIPARPSRTPSRRLQSLSGRGRPRPSR
jgi:hypothetical protein